MLFTEINIKCIYNKKILNKEIINKEILLNNS